MYSGTLLYPELSYQIQGAIIDDKVILEVKALEEMPGKLIDQLFDYLRNSTYELGYFVNFCDPKLLMKRVIYTNDRKHRGGA